MRDVTLAEAITASPGEKAAEVLARIERAGHGHAVIVDHRGRPTNWLSRRQLSQLGVIGERANPELPLVVQGSTLSDALDTMLASSAGAALVTGRGNAFLGVITVEVVMEAIARVRAAARSTELETPVGTNAVPDPEPGAAE